MFLVTYSYSKPTLRRVSIDTSSKWGKHFLTKSGFPVLKIDALVRSREQVVYVSCVGKDRPVEWFHQMGFRDLRDRVPSPARKGDWDIFAGRLRNLGRMRLSFIGSCKRVTHVWHWQHSLAVLRVASFLPGGKMPPPRPRGQPRVGSALGNVPVKWGVLGSTARRCAIRYLGFRPPGGVLHPRLPQRAPFRAICLLHWVSRSRLRCAGGSLFNRKARAASAAEACALETGGTQPQPGPTTCSRAVNAARATA